MFLVVLGLQCLCYVLFQTSSSRSYTVSSLTYRPSLHSAESSLTTAAKCRRWCSRYWTRSRTGTSSQACYQCLVTKKGRELMGKLTCSKHLLLAWLLATPLEVLYLYFTKKWSSTFENSVRIGIVQWTVSSKKHILNLGCTLF